MHEIHNLLHKIYEILKVSFYTDYLAVLEVRDFFQNGNFTLIFIFKRIITLKRHRTGHFFPETRRLGIAIVHY